MKIGQPGKIIVSKSRRLRKNLNCPSCWEKIDTLDLLWISEHQELRGDLRLKEQPIRFLPTRFTPDGRALDMKGFPSSQIACPHCHLQIPRSLLEFREFPIAILGAPSSGKSFFLGSLTWTLRGTLPSQLNLSFDDADASANLIVNEYEQSLFMTEGDGSPVALPEMIRKTLTDGALYRTVRYADHEAQYSVPFSFSMVPTAEHAQFSKRHDVGRTVLLYDTAGEHFLPGRTEDSLSITRNLSGCSALLFVFDPTQDVQFRRFVRASGVELAETSSRSQIPVLQEAATRIRRFTGMPQSEKAKQPLIVVLTKCDSWMDRRSVPKTDFLTREADGRQTLDLALLQKVSDKMRKILQTATPQLVNAADSFSHKVYFVPVSAVGWDCKSATSDVGTDASSNSYSIKPEMISPLWVTIPFLLAMQVTSRHLL